MWRMCMSILVSTWIMISPAMWPHRWEHVVLSVLIGFGGMLLAMAAVPRPNLRTMVYALGAIRALSAFAFPDSFTTTVDVLTSGVLLAVGGMYPEMVVVPVTVARVEPALEAEAPPTKMAA